MYRPTEALASERIERAHSRISEEDRFTISQNIRSLVAGLQNKKDQHAAEMNGRPGKRTALQFGAKSQLELMSRLGTFLAEWAQDNPEDWEQVMRWAKTRKV